jgi:hypothetical protein
LAVAINASRHDRWVCGLVAKALGYTTLIAGACFTAGVLLGFLFGFRPAQTTQNSDKQLANSQRQPHTNLEEIADWLTKIILGATLVQLKYLKGQIWSLANTMAEGINPAPPTQLTEALRKYCQQEQASPAIALAVMAFFFFCGILYGYIWTRWEFSLSPGTVDQDALALDLVDRWLNQTTTLDETAESSVVSAIANASPPARARILLKAEDHRKLDTPDAVLRTLPIFRALVEAAPQELSHRMRSQYAFALMDMKKDPSHPDANWRRALDLLSEAICIRDSTREQGLKEYELARAVCQINLDPNFKSEKPSAPQDQQSILAGLSKAEGVPKELAEAIDRGHVIAAWKQRNSV